MKVNIDFGSLPVREVGCDTFYVQDENLRMVFTRYWEYIYTYNFVKPKWK